MWQVLYKEVLFLHKYTQMYMITHIKTKKWYKMYWILLCTNGIANLLFHGCTYCWDNALRNFNFLILAASLLISSLLFAFNSNAPIVFNCKKININCIIMYVKFIYTLI